MNPRALINRATPLLALWGALLLAHNAFAWSQATTGTCAAGTLTGIAKSATASPNDSATFTTAVAAAYTANTGGVFDFPSNIGTATVSLQGTYGAGNGKKVILTPTGSTKLYNITTSGTSFGVLSPPNGCTTSADATGYSLTVGIPVDATTGDTLQEAVVQLAFTALSRNNATYPIDLTATVYFSDGTTQAVTANLAKSSGGDNTFFGFTAPSGAFITNVSFAAFSPGTTTPVSTRIGIDDIGFITASTVPPPEVRNASPFNYAIAQAANGVSFNAYSFVAVPAAGISMKLNDVDVTSQLAIGGTDTDTNRTVTCGGLVANQSYNMQITVTNSAGAITANSWFYTYENGTVIFDSGGFSDATVYPIGPLQVSTNSGCVWMPPVDAAEIWDTGDTAYGKALKETQMGIDETTYLQIPPVASGILRIGFDARAHDPSLRSLDVGINQVQITRQGSFISWGAVANQVGYYNGTAWIGLAAVDSGWHHYEFLSYLSGSSVNKFDLYMDGTLIGDKLTFRTTWNAQAAAGYVRFGAANGAATEYGIVDNLVVSVGPVASPPMAVTLTNFVAGANGVSFSFQSQLGATHTVQNSDLAGGGTWTNLISILGDGTLKTVTDTNIFATQYYRVSSQ